MKRREDLTSPRASRRIGVQYDSDAFGNFSESIANFLGTARFLGCVPGYCVYLFENTSYFPIQKLEKIAPNKSSGRY